MVNGGMIVVNTMTMTRPACNSLSNIPLKRPGSAKISPTSPRGIIDIPIMIFEASLSLITNAPISFPTIAAINSAEEKAHTWDELQSISLRLIDRPTITKNIGINRLRYVLAYNSLKQLESRS